MTSPALDRPRRALPLRSQSFEIIRDAIFNGQFQPGESLPELKLARMLGVSQATIREAMAQLEQVGLVNRTPSRGALVTNLTQQDVRDRTRVRVTLEEMAWSDCCGRLAEPDFEHLARLARQVSEAFARGDYFEASQTDLAFHLYVWQRSGNPVLCRMLEQLTIPLFAFLVLLRRTRAIGVDNIMPHEDLLHALRKGERELVRGVVRAHIENTYAAFLNSGISEMRMLAAAPDEQG